MDLKEFLENNIKFVEPSYQAMRGTTVRKLIHVEDLGMYYWFRGGKQFVDYERIEADVDNLEILINHANYVHEKYVEDCHICSEPSLIENARDFLDALACLGEEKIKELIKEGVKE